MLRRFSTIPCLNSSKKQSPIQSAIVTVFASTCKFSSTFAFREILSNDWCPIVKNIEKRVMLNNKFTHFTTAETLGSLETGGVADFFWEHLLESLGSLKRMEKHY